MDNITYDTLNLTPSNDNDTYSKLSTVQQFPTNHLQTGIRLQDNNGRIQRRPDNNIPKQSAKRRKTVLIALVLLMAIILLTSLVSIAVSVAACT